MQVVEWNLNIYSCTSYNKIWAGIVAISAQALTMFDILLPLMMVLLYLKKIGDKAMRKILSRIGLGLLLLLIVSVVLCFYFGEFTYAYSLIVVLLIVFGGMGSIYKLKNDEYMYNKLNGRDEYDEYTR